MDQSEKVDELLQVTARIETKLDFHKETIDSHGKRIASIEKRWWTALGGVVLALGAWLRQLLSEQ